MLPLVKIKTIDELKLCFSWDNTLKYSQNKSIISNKFLIDTLQKEGYNFPFTINKEPKGKPYFLHNKNIHFSISHTKDYIAIVISPSRVGIDIESLREVKMDLVQRFFHPNEMSYLINQNADCVDKAFTQLWTIKEAYVKMTGTGIANNFSSIDLSPIRYTISQDYYKNAHHLVSYFDTDSHLFVSLCE